MEIIKLCELQKLEELKARLKEDVVGVNDEILEFKDLVRWLRARNGDVEKAEKMLLDHLNWKRSINIGSIRSEKFPSTWGRETHPCWISGSDEFGNLVLCIPLGKFCFSSICENDQIAQYTRFAIREWDFTVRALKAQSRDKEWMCQVIGIFDFEGLKYSEFCSFNAIKLGHSLIKMWDLQFPEILRKIFILNAPSAFKLVETVMYPLIAERTLRKFTLLGNNKAKWREEIGNFVPPSEFPEMYGGDGQNGYDMRDRLNAIL